MKSTFVFATADSRLQADIMLIRLRRAGINVDHVSAIFSNRFAPNSFFFWLRTPHTLRSTAREQSLYVAGPLQESLSRDQVEAIPRSLRKLGLSRQEAAHFAQSLWLGHAVICVHAKNQDEASIAWHIFKHSRAEDIAVTGTLATDRASEPVTDTPHPAWAPAFAA